MRWQCRDVSQGLTAQSNRATRWAFQTASSSLVLVRANRLLCGVPRAADQSPLRVMETGMRVLLIEDDSSTALAN
jgi:hypothetical protein